MPLKGSSITDPKIKVFGMFGRFTVATPDPNRVVVNYFSTVASGSDSKSAGNSLSLLRELKPMRERVRVSDLRDLSSLLQRELDDRRVATELVPYLKGDSSPVGFFPGILVALVPNGFLRSEAHAQYPRPSDISSVDGESVQEFEGFWSTHRFELEGNLVSLGRLEIDPKTTDLIVLDGQHRANAFRFATKTFDAVQQGDSIYNAFYEGVEPPEDFDAQLPVTIVWFESEEPIEPRLISRKLFVDVNTQAKPVSESRNILLDDRRRASIVTGSIYRLLADRAFDTDRLSLLHAGFDCEEGEAHEFALLLPSIVNYAMAYTAFGRDEVDDLSHTISSDFFNKASNYARLRRISGDVDEGSFRAAEGGDRSAFEGIAKALEQSVSPRLLAILENHPLSLRHVEASALLDEWVANQAAIIVEVWDKVFRGGEGLYGGFGRRANRGDDELGVRTTNYRRAISEIEGKFVTTRSDLFAADVQDRVLSAYRSYKSKAGITALLMAAHVFCSSEEDGWGAVDQYVVALQTITADQWVILLSDYKATIAPELSPKLWTVNRNIILRAIQGRCPAKEFFGASTISARNPDVLFVQNKVRQSVEAYASYLPTERIGEKPGEGTLAAWSNEAVTTLREVLAAASFEPINSDEALRTVAYQEASSAVEKRFPRAVGDEASERYESDEEDGSGQDPNYVST
jgi:hypothetical protein